MKHTSTPQNNHARKRYTELGQSHTTVRHILGTCETPLLYNTGPDQSPHAPDAPERERSPGVPGPSGARAFVPAAVADRAPVFADRMRL